MTRQTDKQSGGARRQLRRFAALVSGALSLAFSLATGQPDKSAQPAQPVAVSASLQSDNVAFVRIEGPIDSLTARSVDRRLRLAAEQGADAVVLDIDTPGGEVGAVLEICSYIKTTAVPLTVAWVNDQAYSGGTYIALACDAIVVAPYISFGDAAEIQVDMMGQVVTMSETERQKRLVPLIAEVVDSARRNGYDERLVQGFITLGVEMWLAERADTGERRFIGPEEYRLLFSSEPSRTGSPTVPSVIGGDAVATDSKTTADAGDGAVDLEIGAPVLADVASDISLSVGAESNRRHLTAEDPGKWKVVEYVSDGGTLLVLKSEQMRRFGLAISTVSSEREIEALLGSKSVVHLGESWAEKAGRSVGFLNHPIIRSLLIVVFLVGVFLEIASPGVSLPGAVAAAALIALLTPAMLVGLANWWEVVAIIAGIALIGVELLILPGFGVPGVAGILLLFLGLVGTFVHQDGLFPNSPTESGGLLSGVVSVLLAFATSGVVIYFVSKNLASFPLLNRLVLSTRTGDINSGDEMIAAMALPVEDLRVGDVGVAMSSLRPVGTARFGERTVEVTAALGHVDPGQRVTIVGIGEFGAYKVEPVAE